MPVMPSSVFNSTIVRKAYDACNPCELRKGGSEIHNAVQVYGRYVHLSHSGSGESDGIQFASRISEAVAMAATIIGVAFLGSLATAFVVERAVLGAMFGAMKRDRIRKAQ